MTEKELDQADHIYKHGGDPKPTDHKAEAMKLHTEMFYDTFSDKFDHTDCRTCGLITALLERLCGEAREAEEAETLIWRKLVDDLRQQLVEAQRGEALAEERRGEALILLDRLIASAENTGSGTRQPVKAARAYLAKELEREKSMLRAIVSPTVSEAKP